MSVRPTVETEPDREFAVFKRQVLRISGLDLNAYKHKQMHRRLTSFRGRLGAESWSDLAGALASSADALQQFRDFVTINVSELFRNAEKFEQLQRDILPRLARSEAGLRVWSAGCSYGAEPYTIAMLLNSVLPGRSHTIIATDIDQSILDRAAQGRGFTESDVRNVPRVMQRRYLAADEDGTWSVANDLKRMIDFRRHDLLRDPYPERLDLIVCRNVVIYFTDDAKAQIYRGFFGALRPGGMLFVGGTEIVGEARAIGYQTDAISFYGRPSA